MEIKFLGTGGAFDYTKGSASATVKTSEGLFLIDCGPSIYPALNEHTLLDKIDYFLPTHLHGDHTGGLFQLVVHLKHKLDTKLKIVYPHEQSRKEMQAFLALMHQFDNAVEYVPIDSFETVHFVDTFGQHCPEMPTVAYYFSENDELIYYSADLGNVNTTVGFLQERPEEKIRVFHDINPKVGRAHAYYKEAAEKLKDYDIYGYHCDKATMPEDNTVKLVEEYPDLNY